MSRTCCVRWAAALAVAGLCGCAAQHTSITGENVEQEQVVHGEVGITGEDHEVTILAGSDVSKLSIWGEDIRVHIADGAVVRKIEIIGEDNTVSCPPGLPVAYSAIGDDNKLRYREDP